MPKNKSRAVKSAEFNSSFRSLRRDFQSGFFSESNALRDPMVQFSAWFEEAVRTKVTDANAFVLATAGKSGPAGRVLLMKGYSRTGITFFTNYESNKGKQIALYSKGEAVFYWPSLNRQIRLGGTIKKVSAQESQAYFRSRPRQAQLAALASEQSRGISSRTVLEKKFRELDERYKGQLPDMPKSWGGYELKPNRVEFWQGRPNRLHDRLLFVKSGKNWKLSRLQP